MVVSASLGSTDLLDERRLRRLYLGRRTTLGGVRVECLALPPGSPARERFNERILGLDEDELADYWIEQALLGGALPPLEFATPLQVIERVRDAPRSIGYILARPGLPVPEGVRILPIGR